MAVLKNEMAVLKNEMAVLKKEMAVPCEYARSHVLTMKESSDTLI